MGRLVYGSHGSVEIDDRALAHLRIVFIHKLRRSEPFMFDITAVDGSGRRSFWIHPAADIQFHFFGNRHAHINRTWIDELVLIANRPDGLTIIPEPLEPVVQQSRTRATRGTGRA